MTLSWRAARDSGRRVHRARIGPFLAEVYQVGDQRYQVDVWFLAENPGRVDRNFKRFLDAHIVYVSSLGEDPPTLQDAKRLAERLIEGWLRSTGWLPPSERSSWADDRLEGKPDAE